MDRRKFLAGLGAALLAVPLLPAPVKAKALEWRCVGWMQYSVKVHPDGRVDVQQVGEPVWTMVPADDDPTR